jgi:hypothetical protein
MMRSRYPGSLDAIDDHRGGVSDFRVFFQSVLSVFFLVLGGGVSRENVYDRSHTPISMK